ncbi:kynureninase [Janibacter sp. G1551]|uniref:kynureninase n=1 Tax=Janibacter sp. G1551 TaxID=3420440 RepID=UPI003D0046AB
MDAVTPTLADAQLADRDDPLAAFGELFLAPEDDGLVAYLDGNSLGRPPRATADRLAQIVRGEWGSRLIRSWTEGGPGDRWWDAPTRVGDLLGAGVLGAAAGQVVVADSTTVCLYKALRAAVAMRPGRDEIVTDRHNFPTDRYVVEGIADELGLTIRWIESDPDGGVSADEVAEVLSERTAVVTLSHVAYRSAHIADLPGLTRLAHDAGALTVWDLCHSAGAIPVDLDATEADFAVGCTYKFLCAGPGAPAFVYVREVHHAELAQPIRGWVGADEPFEMGPTHVPATGIRRMLSGTPPVLAMVGVEEGARIVADAGIDAIRAKGVALTELVCALADAWLLPLGFRVASPRDPAVRGAHVTLARADARALAARLIAAGVIIDFRAPDGIRVGVSPLTTTHEEVWRAMDVIRELAGDGAST